MTTVALRELTTNEVELVSGGNNSDIVVTGHRDDYWDYDPWAFLNDYYGYEDYYDYGSGDGQGGGSTEDHSLAEATEAALQITEAKHNVLQDLINRYGPNTTVQLPNGTVAKATDLLAGVGQITTILQGGLTIAEVIDGGKNAHDALYFLFGVTVTAMAAEAGAGAVLAGALGFGAEYAAGHILEWMEAMGDLNDQLQEYFNEQIAEWVQNNSDIPPDAYDNPIDMIRGMMGWPVFNYDGDYNIP